MAEDRTREALRRSSAHPASELGGDTSRQKGKSGYGLFDGVGFEPSIKLDGFDEVGPQTAHDSPLIGAFCLTDALLQRFGQ